MILIFVWALFVMVFTFCATIGHREWPVGPPLPQYSSSSIWVWYFLFACSHRLFLRFFVAVSRRSKCPQAGCLCQCSVRRNYSPLIVAERAYCLDDNVLVKYSTDLPGVNVSLLLFHHTHRKWPHPPIGPVDPEEAQVWLHKRHASGPRQTGRLPVDVVHRIPVLPEQPRGRRPRRTELECEGVPRARVAAAIRADQSADFAVASALDKAQAEHHSRPPLRGRRHHQAHPLHPSGPIRPG